MTDSAWLLDLLRDGKAHSLGEILRRSFNERGHGLTVHSRVSDLRKQGHDVLCGRVAGKERGEGWIYRLALGETRPEAEPCPVSEGCHADALPRVSPSATAASPRAVALDSQLTLADVA